MATKTKITPPGKAPKRKPKPKGRKRLRIYVSRIPGVRPVRFHIIITSVVAGGRAQPDDIPAAYPMTQAAALRQAIAIAKNRQPASVFVQRAENGAWREVFSYPAVRDKNERK